MEAFRKFHGREQALSEKLVLLTEAEIYLIGPILERDRHGNLRKGLDV
jgi:hypothetical protein